jgi:hypothetical protein
MPNESPETPEMRVVKTLIAGLREAERDRLLRWLAARYDVRGRERQAPLP